MFFSFVFALNMIGVTFQRIIQVSPYLVLNGNYEIISNYRYINSFPVLCGFFRQHFCCCNVISKVWIVKKIKVFQQRI